MDVDFKKGRQMPEPVSKSGHDRCAINGCTRDGHIFTGQWNCRYHHGVAGNRLAHVTLMIRNHAQEFDWHEKLLTANAVDFAMGSVARDAPHQLRVLPGEDFYKYRTRVNLHIQALIGVPKKNEARPVTPRQDDSPLKKVEFGSTFIEREI
jgi:hypothetical protein